MKGFLVSLLVLLNCLSALGADYLRPEQYGATGDGIHDDSPAFNACLSLGKEVRLTKGKTYLLKSLIRPIDSDLFYMNGNAAKIVFPSEFPARKSEHIFCFKKRDKQSKVKVFNMKIDCQLPQKFDSAFQKGDTFIFYFETGEKATFKDVDFSCTSTFNNVSFLVSMGMPIEMDHCHIVLNTLSKQGGILWLMDRYSDFVNVELKNSYFEHDAQDEAMCFSLSRIGNNYIPRCKVNATVNNCTFFSPGNSPSSGFIIAYNHNPERYADIKVRYDNCHFKARGQHSRYIQTYQCGKDSLNYGRFATTFNKCDFDFSFTEALHHGSVYLLRMKNAIPKEDISYTFNHCNFKFHNVGCVIGDRDADCKGVYTFNGCEIKTDGRAFRKKYNARQGDIDVVVRSTKSTSMDENKLNTKTISQLRLCYPQSQ